MTLDDLIYLPVKLGVILRCSQENLGDVKHITRVKREVPILELEWFSGLSGKLRRRQLGSGLSDLQIT